jgi:hypothetical protein
MSQGAGRGRGRGRGGPGFDTWVGKKVICIGRGKNKGKIGLVKSDTETVLQVDFDCTAKTETVRRADAKLYDPSEITKVCAFVCLLYGFGGVTVSTLSTALGTGSWIGDAQHAVHQLPSHGLAHAWISHALRFCW